MLLHHGSLPCHFLLSCMTAPGALAESFPFRFQSGEQAVGGCMIPSELTPHAAAALQFWLSQGALNPHVHASYLHSLQGPFGEPLGHHFSGSCPERQARHDGVNCMQQKRWVLQIMARLPYCLSINM